MNIGIYGKDSLWQKKAKEIIGEHLRQISLDGMIYCYTKKDSLLEIETENQRMADVLFLDLDYGENRDSDGGNGIDMAALINKKWPECQIVYCSENLNYATEVYSTVHTYFVLKEQLANRIENIFQRIFWELRQRKKRMVFSVIGGKKISLLPEEILYFERVKRITRIVSSFGEYEIRDKLDSIAEKLPQREFLRCHNSYIINRFAVYEKGKNCFVMRNGDNVAISRSYVKTIREFLEKEQ